MLRLTILVSLVLYQDMHDKIPWSSTYELEWSDYRCTPDNDSPFSAISQCGFNVEYETRTDSLLIIAYAYFDRTTSWVKIGKKSDALLLHEQRHFDIAELFARKLRCELKNSVLGQENYEKIIQSVIQANMNAYRIYQDSYDDATSFSTNHRAQKEWNTEIKNDLEALDDWQDVSFLVPLRAQ